MNTEIYKGREVWLCPRHNEVRYNLIKTTVREVGRKYFRTNHSPGIRFRLKDLCPEDMCDFSMVCLSHHHFLLDCKGQALRDRIKQALCLCRVDTADGHRVMEQIADLLGVEVGEA
jgi:hypothetical protein